MLVNRVAQQRSKPGCHQSGRQQPGLQELNCIPAKITFLVVLIVLAVPAAIAGVIKPTLLPAYDYEQLPVPEFARDYALSWRKQQLASTTEVHRVKPAMPAFPRTDNWLSAIPVQDRASLKEHYFLIKDTTLDVMKLEGEDIRMSRLLGYREFPEAIPEMVPDKPLVINEYEESPIFHVITELRTMIFDPMFWVVWCVGLAVLVWLRRWIQLIPFSKSRYVFKKRRAYRSKNRNGKEQKIT